jgi:hypothetical protein
MNNDFYGEPRHVRTPEDWLLEALLRMVLDHCARPDGTLDSYMRPANAEAMRLLAEAGFISVDSEIDDRIRATPLQQAKDFLAWMAKADIA